jgi:hypothetical protein
MKVFNVLVVSILLLSGVIRAQDNYNLIRLKLGYGSYNMSDLERIQNFLIDIYAQQQIFVTAVDKFPPYWNYQVQFLRKLNDSFGLSGFFGYASTGGRIHYSDYSGEIKSDQVVSANLYGAGCEYIFNPSEPFKYFIAFQASIIFSSLELNDMIRIYSETASATTKLNSTGVGIEPSAGLEFNLMSLLFRFEAGVFFNFEGTFYFEEDPDVDFKLEGNEISPNWMGYRIGFSIGYGF